MYNSGVFFSVVYPQALPYLKDVLTSLLDQTRQDFDVLVVNDGCEKNQIIKTLQGVNLTILNAEGGFSRNRMQGINFARSHNYKYILFCDADDTFTAYRYQRTIEEFENSQADIIVSNLNIVNEKLESVIREYFDKEIPDERWIDTDFLNDKNIFGMSNTAIRLDALTEDIHLPDTPVVDWLLFTLLLLKGLNAKYIKDSLVNYRQYSSNMIGINKFDVVSFRRLADLKTNHYRLLSEAGYNQYKPYRKVSELLLHLSDDEIESIVKKELAVHPQPLWWQIIKR